MLISFDTWFALENKNEYKKLHFYDEKSYRVLEGVLECMITNKHDGIYREIENSANQYFAIGPFLSSGLDEVFVDLGAYTGDVIEKFIYTNLGEFDTIYAF